MNREELKGLFPSYTPLTFINLKYIQVFEFLRGVRFADAL